MTSCQIGKQGRISIYPTGTTASMLSCCPYGPPRSPRSTASHSVLQVLVVQCFCDQARSVTTVPYQFINRKPRPTVSDLAPGIRLAATSICHCRSMVVSSVPRKLAEATSSMQITIPVPTHLSALHLTQSIFADQQFRLISCPLQAVAEPDFAMQF